MDKLFILIRRARPEEVTGDARKFLQEIEDSCESCKYFAARKFRFTASLGPQQLLLNHEVGVDLMWLDGNHVLHVVDTPTHYQDVIVLRSKRAEDIWFAFVG